MRYVAIIALALIAAPTSAAAWVCSIAGPWCFDGNGWSDQWNQTERVLPKPRPKPKQDKPKGENSGGASAGAPPEDNATGKGRVFFPDHGGPDEQMFGAK